MPGENTLRAFSVAVTLGFGFLSVFFKNRRGRSSQSVSGMCGATSCVGPFQNRGDRSGSPACDAGLTVEVRVRHRPRGTGDRSLCLAGRLSLSRQTLPLALGWPRTANSFQPNKLFSLSSERVSFARGRPPAAPCEAPFVRGWEAV